MGSLFRVSLALCCLCPAWGLLKLAHWICPELKAPNTKPLADAFWAADQGWNGKVN
jgi:hypothetical protein